MVLPKDDKVRHETLLFHFSLSPPPSFPRDSLLSLVLWQTRQQWVKEIKKGIDAVSMLC